jgi:protein-S-isoprenylcysteine O-methyltransferase Ste14
MPERILSIVAILSIVSVEYGGWPLLTSITGHEGLSPARQRFFRVRAGHAHAGVLLLLSLVYFLYLPRADWSTTAEWLAGGILLLGALAQSGGFFVHLAAGAPDASSRGTKLTRAGALLIAGALIASAAGLVRTA